MGLEIEYTGSDGKKYKSLADMMGAEATQIVDDHLAAVERAIANERCPVHGQHASVKVTRTSEGASFEITGCCDELVERAQAAASAVS